MPQHASTSSSMRPQLREIQVLAVFFGGQDHQRHMLVRLLQKTSQL